MRDAIARETHLLERRGLERNFRGLKVNAPLSSQPRKGQGIGSHPCERREERHSTQFSAARAPLERLLHRATRERSIRLSTPHEQRKTCMKKHKGSIIGIAVGLLLTGSFGSANAGQIHVKGQVAETFLGTRIDLN